MAKLGASILSADLARLAEEVKLVGEHADLIHIDVMDGHFVPPLTIGPMVVAALRPHTDRPLHAHLQVEAPDGFLDELAGAGTDAVSFHLEAVTDPAPTQRKVRGLGMRAGIALAPRTPAEAAFAALEDADDVIVLPSSRDGRANRSNPRPWPRSRRSVRRSTVATSTSRCTWTAG